MEEAGDDLTRARNVDFTVVFPNEATAEKFANHFRGHGYAVSVEFNEAVEGFPWDVIVVKYMMPTYEEIAAFEDSLHCVAMPLGGHNDGWGSSSERPS